MPHNIKVPVTRIHPLITKLHLSKEHKIHPELVATYVYNINDKMRKSNHFHSHVNKKLHAED